MLRQNSQGHIYCPPLIAGLTTADLLAWYAAKVGGQYDTLVKRYGTDKMLDLAVMAYSQERFIALADGAEPQTDDERDLAQVWLGGAPVSLTPVGLESEDEAAGLYPWLERDGKGWRWRLNDIRSKPFANVAQALRSYEAFARTTLTAV
jgi:hypothetical protein